MLEAAFPNSPLPTPAVLLKWQISMANPVGPPPTSKEVELGPLGSLNNLYGCELLIEPPCYLEAGLDQGN